MIKVGHAELSKPKDLARAKNEVDPTVPAFFIESGVISASASETAPACSRHQDVRFDVVEKAIA
jgi:hypothetical protein